MRKLTALILIAALVMMTGCAKSTEKPPVNVQDTTTQTQDADMQLADIDTLDEDLSTDLDSLDEDLNFEI